MTMAESRHIAYGDAAVRVKLGLDDTHRRFDAVRAGFYAARVRQRDDQPDGAVAAHAEETDIVAEADAGRAVGAAGCTQQSANQHVRSARLRSEDRRVGKECVSQCRYRG